MMRKAKRVVVGMSGGVDSTVSAYLLKKKGFDVIALHMINWDQVEEGVANCPRSKDESDARDVCKRLEIPFYTTNFVKEYWNEVFVKFLDNYKQGRTTVPDIDCNQKIKFNHFHRVAKEKFNADYIATGHYASTSFGDFQENYQSDKEISLLCGKDPLKDQTYFLCTINQEQLKSAMFPVGSLYKTEVKKIAESQGFHSIQRKAESMGICFVGKKTRFDEFIDQYIEEKQGMITLSNGPVIGEHNGVHHFTIGKRIHGKYLNKRSHFGYFVADIDPNRNLIIACEGSTNPLLYAIRFAIKTPKWIMTSTEEAINNVISTGGEVKCRIQRSHQPIACRLHRLTDDLLMVEPRIPLRATAPGQVCVFYNGNVCLGGGEIVHIINRLE